MDASEKTAPVPKRTSSRLKVMLGLLAAIGVTYLLLPRSWFEVPKDIVAPANKDVASTFAAPSAADLDTLRSAAASRPLDFEARSKFGMALAAAGNPKEAEGELRSAIRLAPDNPTVYHNLGALYLNSGQPVKAKRLFDKVLEIVPGDARGHYSRGLALQQMGKAEPASGEFRLATRLAPNLAEPYLSLATTIAGKAPVSEVKELADKSVTLGGNRNVANFVLSRAYREKHQYPEAVSYAEAAVKDLPDSYSNWHNLGQIYSYAKKHADAERALKRAAELAKDPTTVRIELGMNAQSAGRIQDAIGYFQKALASGPETGNIHLYLARNYQRLGDQQSARKEELLFREWNKKQARARPSIDVPNPTENP